MTGAKMKDRRHLINLIRNFDKKYILDLFNIFGFIIFAISFFIPRKKNIWVFGSWSGKRFSDNAKYLYLYISKNKKNIDPIWISKDRSIIKKLRHDKYKAYYAYEPMGIYYNLRARYIFTDSYLYSVNFWCCGGAVIVQLWHGIPLKKIEYDTNLPWYNNIFIKYLFFYMRPWLYKRYDYIISSSNYFVDIFASAFHTKRENIIVTGYPRNDLIFNYINGSDLPDEDIYDMLIKIKRKLIFYVPTFRDTSYNADNKFNNIIDVNILNEYLKQKDIFFIVKLHPIVNIRPKCDHDRIIFLPNNFDIYPILRYIDILITDYSSIYFDFLLTNKPIIFYPYDIEQYLKIDREMYFDYGEFTPGPKVFNFEDLLCCIDIFIEGSDEFVESRKRIRDIVFKYNDGESSQRIYDFMVKL